MSGSHRKLLAVGVGLVGVIGLRVVLGGSDLPDEASDAVTYICTEDQTSFTLTPRQLDEARRKAGGMKPGYAPCAACGRQTAVRAREVDGKLVAIPPRDDDAGELFRGESR